MKWLRAEKMLAAVSEHGAPASAWSALWTFPSMIGAAFVVAWGAEAAEFLISQGLALAMLALIQTMPEFAVEAVIAWKAGKDPDMVHLAIANFTGSLRLLTGFGWPMIYAVAACSSRRRRGQASRRDPAPRRSCRRGPGPAAAADLLRAGLGEGKPVARSTPPC